MNNYLFAKINKNTKQFEGNYIDGDGNNSLSINKVNSMGEDHLGNLWLGTSEGINYLDLSENKIKSLGNNFKYNDQEISLGSTIMQLNILNQDKLWFLSKYELGLLNTKTKTIERYFSLQENWSEGPVHFINQGDTAVWVGHSSGLVYHHFPEGTNINISLDKGLDTKGAILTMKQLLNKKIAIGTNNGLHLFHPDSLLNECKTSESLDKQIPLLIDKISIIDGNSNEELSQRFVQNQGDEITINYNDKMLRVEFSLMNLSFPNSHSYSYKLEGYDRDWSAPSNSNYVVFTSLPPGQYTLKVRGSGASGLWSENVIHLPIKVKEAWFRTWTFIILSILALAGIIYAMTLYYFNQKLLRRKGIEQLRTKISNDLHDDVGSILAGLSMQSELMALTYKEGDKENLMEITHSSREAMEKMRDIVWAMDSNRDKFENLIDRMKTFIDQQLKSSKMSYNLNFDDINESKFIKPDVRQNLYLIFKEAITNAAKHSNGDHVEVIFKKDRVSTVLSVKDNGTALDHRKKEGIGLSSIKNRAKNIGAQVKTLHEDGFELRIIIPNAGKKD